MPRILAANSLIGRREVRLKTPAEAVDLGIGYIPRERRVEGLVLFLSVAANITLADLGGLIRHGFISASEERRLAKTWVDRLRVQTPGIETLCLSLSGGNQQKVVLAKWLNAKAKVLILDHPTRGIDVGAKEEVYELVRAVTAEGVAVILDIRYARRDDRAQPHRAGDARWRGHLPDGRLAWPQAPPGRPHRTHGLRRR